MNNYAAALQAIVADEQLRAALSDASSSDERSSILRNAGLTIPTQSDVNAYHADPDMAVEGAEDLTGEVFWLAE